MAKLSEWLRIMLGEIARKQDEAARAAVEQKQRQAAQGVEQRVDQGADLPVRSAAR